MLNKRVTRDKRRKRRALVVIREDAEGGER